MGMNIKKIGHCCLIIKTNGVTIVTDPGSFTTAQDELTGVNVILVTHEHQDHFHIDSVKKMVANNPGVKIITNATVGKLLEKEGIAWELVAQGGKNDAHGVLIEGYGCSHAMIYGDWGQTENTGYFVDGKLFYPGDAFTNPNRPIDILAIPAGGPWMKLPEAIEYALALQPRAAFPVHDALYNDGSIGFLHKMLESVLAKNNIAFTPMVAGEEKDL